LLDAAAVAHLGAGCAAPLVSATQARDEEGVEGVEGVGTGVLHLAPHDRVLDGPRSTPPQQEARFELDHSLHR